MNKELILKEINNSSWPESNKKKLVTLFSQCGEYVLQFLFLALQDRDNDLITDVIVEAVEEGVAVVNQARQGNSGPFVDFLDVATYTPGLDFGRYVIPFVIDFKRNNSKLSPSVEQAINEFEVLVFKDLPIEEIKYVLKYNLLYFMEHLNLILELQRISYYRNIEFTDKLGQDFLFIIENNEEQLGSGTIVMDSREEKATVKNWIKDSIGSVARTTSERNTFNEIQYLQKSANVRKLSRPQQEMLLEIFKVRDWFLNPTVSREEVENYEHVLEEELEKHSASALKVPQYVGPTPAVKPVAPPLPLPNITAPVKIFEKPTGVNVNIDRKLEELKKKVK